MIRGEPLCLKNYEYHCLMKVGGIMYLIRNLFGIEINVNINGSFIPRKNSPDPKKIIVLLLILVFSIVAFNSDRVNDDLLKALLDCFSKF